jgi:molybdopterin converting factor small subunit
MDNVNNQVGVNEADAASNMSTITAKPTEVSRSELMAKMVDYAAKASKEDLAAFIASIGGEPAENDHVPTVDALASNNKGAENGAGDNSAKNAATIKSSGKHADPMPSIKEDLEIIFGDSDELSEDFRVKVSTLFEAAVSTRVNLEVAKIEENYETLQGELSEQYEQALEESVNEIKNEMVENVDNYLNYAVAEWMTENKLAITNNIRTEMAESFIASLKNVFEDHYVDIPEDKVDVVEALTAELEEMKLRLNETTEKNIELSKVVNEKDVAEIASSMAEGMTDTQKDKFIKLTEAVSYNDANEFRKKVAIIKETYFPKTQEVRVVQDQLLNETVEEPVKTPSLDPLMQNYVSSISRSAKR